MPSVVYALYDSYNWVAFWTNLQAKRKVRETNCDNVDKRRFTSVLQTYQWQLHLLLEKQAATTTPQINPT
jgi:hypothetical protein